ncbi:hypothetical protein M0811_10594 [Anaeramoeba ignava]|uniref:Uncharacterized protein n=1 Tax=Anaeramoeba ignava TaxID=1746090 RepID=A0A9Q0LER7_ANAIG|nr:hypothetical protein M0811_10594 [Anaeramoeba ignava]
MNLLNSGELLNLNISILNYFGEVMENGSWSGDFFLIVAYVDSGNLPMAFATLPEFGYWNITNGAGIISTRIYGISMQTQFCLVAIQKNPQFLREPDQDYWDSQGCFNLSIVNQIEKVEISHSPNLNNYFTPGQPFGNDSIKLKIFPNNISENNFTIQVLALNADDPYGVLLGRNSNERTRNVTTILYQTTKNLTEEGELILDDFVINDQTTYINFQDTFLQNEPFQLQIFVNGVPANSIVSVNLAFPSQDLNLTIDWDTSLPFVSGYQQFYSQPVLQITNNETGEPIQGYYVYFNIPYDSIDGIYPAYAIDYDAGDYSNFVRSLAPSDENGLVTWDLSFEYVLGIGEIYADFYAFTGGEWQYVPIKITISADYLLLQNLC